MSKLNLIVSYQADITMNIANESSAFLIILHVEVNYWSWRLYHRKRNRQFTLSSTCVSSQVLVAYHNHDQTIRSGIQDRLSTTKFLSRYVRWTLNRKERSIFYTTSFISKSYILFKKMRVIAFLNAWLWKWWSYLLFLLLKTKFQEFKAHLQKSCAVNMKHIQWQHVGIEIRRIFFTRI